MHLLKECHRLLQRPARVLLEAPAIGEDTFKPVDVIAVEARWQTETEVKLGDGAEPHAR